jgi:hypothetical protein
MLLFSFLIKTFWSTFDFISNYRIIRFIASPVATALGIKQCRRRPFAHVPVLEEFLKTNCYNTPDDKTMQILSDKAGIAVYLLFYWAFILYYSAFKICTNSNVCTIVQVQVPCSIFHFMVASRISGATHKMCLMCLRNEFTGDSGVG